MTGRWIVIFAIVVGGWGALELMLRQMEIGEHAKSPQYFEIPKGLTVLVGGGRAGLTFVEAPFLRSAVVKVTCKDTDRAVQLRPGEVGDEVCGIRFQLKQLMAGGNAAIEVRWGNDSAFAPVASAMESEPSSPDALANPDASAVAESEQPASSGEL